MISFTEAQWSALVASVLWPFARILALFSTAPLFSEAGVPAIVKIGLAGLLALIVAPVVVPVGAAATVSPFSYEGLWILAQQVLIGVALGFAMQCVFSAVEAAGEFAGLQMGLSFATLITPNSDGSTAVLSMLLNMIAVLTFLALDAHLSMLANLVESFQALPIGGGLGPDGWRALSAWGAQIFTFGLLLALPLIAALLIANLALGILNRAAPQLNIFAVGFPLTLATGLLVLDMLMPRLWPMFEHLLTSGLDEMRRVAAAFATP